MTRDILFFAFGVTAVMSALLVVIFRDPIKGALSLIGCFFSLACLFILQGATLIGVLEVLVYAGAIMVLFVFVIMLVEDKSEPLVAAGLAQRALLPIKLGGVGLLAVGLALFFVNATFEGPAELPEDFGTAASIGRTMFDGFLLHFELTSLLLLTAMVGAVVISKKGSS